MKSIFYIVIISFVFILASCELQTDWNTNTSESIVIVDALITNENTTQIIKVYQSSENINAADTPISGAVITLITDTEEILFTEAEPGIYTANPINLAVGKSYYLNFELEGHKDFAQANMLPVTALSIFEIEQKEELYKYVYTGSSHAAMTEVYYDWSNNPEYCSFYGACQSAETFYTLNSFDIVQEFSPEKQEIQFPENTLVIRKKYSLSDDHQEFIRSLLIETEWRGSLFDVEQGNIPTNFSNGVRGWFGVCQIVTDSVFISSVSN